MSGTAGGSSLRGTRSEDGPLQRSDSGQSVGRVLGTLDATPLQVANAYAVLANGGVLRQPLLIKRIAPETRTHALDAPGDGALWLPGTPEADG